MQDEILKHTKKIYKEAKNPKHTFAEKLKEIFIEILIIVFAVTLSIWLHSWSEEKHQQKEAKAFLIGLKEDLKNDISNLETTKEALNETQQQISFVLKLTPQKIDSIKANHKQINSGTNFINTLVNNGRYEGFKSSGKINTIEDENLRNKILSYYQQTIPQIALIENSYEKLTTRYVDLLINGKEDEDINTTLLKNKTKIILSGINNFTKYNQKSYEDAIKDAKEIIGEIEKENK
jgi:lipopolysaccharide export LptBFGC system permease protein LptF